jgi:SET domain-containing protein
LDAEEDVKKNIRIILVATKDIKVGDEILFDYNPKASKDVLEHHTFLQKAKNQ